MDWVKYAPMKRVRLAALLFAAACSPPPAGESGAPPAAAGGEGFAPDSAVVFAGEKARELTEPCSRPAPGPVEGAWTPSARDIAAMEPALAALLAERLQAEWPRDAGSVSAYRRQYGGLIVGGRRIVTVNGFRLDPHDDLDAWRSFPQTICDGGPIMFGVDYDPATQRFENFAFNGGA